MRTLLRQLADEGRTVFVSSHLMSEMAQTATRLVVLGRGRLIADSTVEQFVAQTTVSSVTVRTPSTRELRERLLGPDVSVSTAGDGQLQVAGLSAEQIGTIAWHANLPLHELTTVRASLEDAFMQVTQDSVEYAAQPQEEVAR